MLILNAMPQDVQCASKDAMSDEGRRLSSGKTKLRGNQWLQLVFTVVVGKCARGLSLSVQLGCSRSELCGLHFVYETKRITSSIFDITIFTYTLTIILRK